MQYNTSSNKKVTMEDKQRACPWSKADAETSCHGDSQAGKDTRQQRHRILEYCSVPHLQYMMLLRLRVSILTTSAATSRELSSIWRAEGAREGQVERGREGKRGRVG